MTENRRIAGLTPVFQSILDMIFSFTERLYLFI